MLHIVVFGLSALYIVHFVRWVSSAAPTLPCDREFHVLECGDKDPQGGTSVWRVLSQFPFRLTGEGW